MKILFTIHSKFRIENRGILKQEVNDAINFPDKTEKRHGKYYFHKKFERGTIELCCEKTAKYIKIITVYWL